MSEPFAPNAQSTLMIQTFFRPSAPDTKVRLWIEGESGGQSYVRRTELAFLRGGTPSGTCLGRSCGGLDTAAARFELLGPGVLWIDDLRILTETASRSARLKLNARCFWP